MASNRRTQGDSKGTRSQTQIESDFSLSSISLSRAESQAGDQRVLDQTRSDRGDITARIANPYEWIRFTSGSIRPVAARRVGHLPDVIADLSGIGSHLTPLLSRSTIPVAAHRGVGHLPDRKSESNGNIIDTSNFAYYEDVAAELEDFMLFSRLGLTELAFTIIEHVLWQHLQIFQVIAEVSTWLFRQEHDSMLLEALQQSARGPGQRLFSAEENNLLLTITPEVLGGRQAELSKYSSVGEQLITRGRTLTEIEIHQAELNFLVAARTGLASSTTDWSLFVRQCQRLVTASLEHDLVQTATHLFSSACNACSSTWHAQRTLYLLLPVYYELTPKLASYSLEQDKGHKSKNVVSMICDLEAKAALYLLIRSVPEERSALSEMTDNLANDITLLLDCLFFHLPELRTKSTYNHLFLGSEGGSPPLPSLDELPDELPDEGGKQVKLGDPRNRAEFLDDEDKFVLSSGMEDEVEDER